MNKELDIFDQVDRYFVGFDKLFDDLRFSSKYSFFNSSKKPYSPYNVQKCSENYSIIEIAAAGFKKQDLDVSVDNDLLIVSGATPGKGDSMGEDYVHRGLSTRSFKRSFRLAENVKVENCHYENGLLTIHISHKQTEVKEPLKIEIK